MPTGKHSPFAVKLCARRRRAAAAAGGPADSRESGDNGAPSRRSRGRKRKEVAVVEGVTFVKEFAEGCFQGVVSSITGDECLVQYEDGDEESIHMQEVVEWVSKGLDKGSPFVGHDARARQMPPAQEPEVSSGGAWLAPETSWRSGERSISRLSDDTDTDEENKPPKRRKRAAQREKKRKPPTERVATQNEEPQASVRKYNNRSKKTGLASSKANELQRKRDEAKLKELAKMYRDVDAFELVVQ